MACPPGTIQYDIDMRTHPPKIDTRLTFCLRIAGPTITGTIEQLPGVGLTGTNTPLALGVDQITLEFAWAPSVVILRGFTFPRGGAGRRFLAEFNAEAPGIRPLIANDADADAAAAPLPPPGPDVGDTGTGTGQTT